MYDLASRHKLIASPPFPPSPSMHCTYSTPSSSRACSPLPTQALSVQSQDDVKRPWWKLEVRATRDGCDYVPCPKANLVNFLTPVTRGHQWSISFTGWWVHLAFILAEAPLLCASSGKLITVSTWGKEWCWHELWVVVWLSRALTQPLLCLLERFYYFLSWSIHRM